MPYRGCVLVQRVAIEPVPPYAVVDEETVVQVVQRVTREDDAVPVLEAAFDRLERRQPAMAGWLADELGSATELGAQTLTYFLFLIVFMSFDEAFGGRLAEVRRDDLARTFDRLAADGELRDATGPAGTYSEDAVSVSQPALMTLIHGEVERALDAAGQAGRQLDVDPIVQALLIEVLALSAAVAPKDLS
jgi:hypothetical protein